MDVNLDAIWERFRCSLRDLSLAAEDQRRFGPGGCLACELLNNFHFASQDFRLHFAAALSPEQCDKLDAISSAFEALEPTDVECFNEEVVGRPAWQRVRDTATDAMKALGCEGMAVPEFIDIYLAIWRRPPS